MVGKGPRKVKGRFKIRELGTERCKNKGKEEKTHFDIEKDVSKWYSIPGGNR